LTRIYSQAYPSSHILLLLLALAFVLRVFLVFFPEVIYNDGTEYVRSAKLILSGNWGESRAQPLYPVLIALASFFISNLELAGIWVSVILGTLVILPVFYLGREIFDEKVGILSGLFAVVHPFLYRYSGSVLTESTYHFLFATSVLFGWNAFNRGGFYRIFLLGLFTTLAYLARPEAIGILLVFSAWTLFFNPPGGERGLAKKTVMILMTLITFFAFSSPYLMGIRRDTGRWSISKKAVLSVGSLSKEEDAPSFGKPRGKKGLTFSSLIKHPVPVMGRMGTGFLSSLYKFIQGLNPILFLLAVVGWVLLLRRKYFSLWKGNFFILSYLIFYFGIVFPLFFISRRYASQMVPLSLPWAAFGFLGLTEWLSERWGKRVLMKRFSVVLLVFVLIGLFIQGRVTHSRERRFIQKEVGLWMKENLPSGSKVMSRLPQEAFYAELAWVGVPGEGYGGVLREARLKEVRYLVVDDEIESLSPGFWKDLKREDLVPVKEFRKNDQRIIIFELVP
jgi:hypothetical protein